MAVTVAVVNMKGGTGKTTVAVNLAWHVSRHKRVLVVDLDPQFNASQYLMGTSRYKKHIDQNKGTVVDIFEQHLPPAISKRPVATEKLEAKDVVYEAGGNLHLIPSRLELSWTLKNPASKEHLLAGFLKTRCGGYDLTLIDCPPTESILTTAAYLASNFVLVPVKPEFLSTIGLPLLDRSLREFGELYGKTEIEVAGIIFNSADPYKGEYDRSKADVTKLAQEHEPHAWYVFQNEMRYSASYAKGARTGEPISWTSYTRWWIKQEFARLGEEFCTAVGL